MTKKLFSPFIAGGLEIKNRIIMAPIGTNYGTKGYVTNRLIDYLVKRAEGGAGLIYLEATFVEFRGVGRDHNLRIYREDYLSGLSELVEAVHQRGALIGVQLNHYGREAKRDFIGTQPVAPSAVPAPWGGDQPAELTIKEIQELVEKFADAALNAKRCGFDLVELHAAHGYLLGQFLSPLANKRRDEYGGDEWGRSRFVIEIIEKARKILGKNFPISVRLSVDEFWPGGLTLNESLKIIRALAKSELDVLSVTAGVRGSMERSIPQATLQKGCYRSFSKAIKNEFKIPVILAGRINSVDIADEIIESGDADLVALGRALLAEPDFPRKAQTNNAEEIRQCISCNMCSDRLFEGLDVRCAVNASAGNEKAFEIGYYGKRKKALIVGGGPGGIEAARVFGLMGHEVTIWEKNVKLGGKVALATKILPSKEELSHLLRWYELQLSKLPVKIVFNKEGTANEIIEFGADFVVLAVGAVAKVLDGVQIDDEARVMYSDQVFEKGKELKGRIGIIGGGWVGLELAEFMLMKGASVIIIERLPNIGAEMDVLSKKVMLEKIRQYPVEILLDTELEKIYESGIIVKDKDGYRDLKLDYVVVAIGYQPNTDILNELKAFEKRGADLKCVAVGDCLGARRVGDAILEGAFSAIDFCRECNHVKNH